MPWVIDCESHPTDIHVMPLEDYRPHDPSLSCWCRPTEEELDGYGHAVLHVALDGREHTTKEGGSIPPH